MALAELIERERDSIVERWLEQAYADVSPRGLDRESVIDDLREMLAEICLKLRADVAGGGSTEPPTLPIAKAHGRQRFRIGYDIAAVVREHGILREVIAETAVRAGYSPTALELSSVSRFLYAALADSASAYAAARDHEVRVHAERYMSFLAHELRNPLGTARLALSVLDESGAMPSHRAVRSLRSALERMQQLIDRDLSDFAARRAPRPECRSLDLASFLRDIAAESEPEASSKRVATHVEVEGDVALDADPVLLRSAVSNLVRNAIKFSAANGAVRIEGKRGQGRVTIAVQDSCGGLPPGSVERLFSPFVQAGVDRSGFGLGLAIAKDAAEAHGGSIRVHDLPGRGCVFVIDLPGRCA